MIYEKSYTDRILNFFLILEIQSFVTVTIMFVSNMLRPRLQWYRTSLQLCEKHETRLVAQNHIAYATIRRIRTSILDF